MAKRSKTDFLPKRVGRIKIPKRIRRSVLGALIGSPAGQAVIAALILKAGARLADRAAATREAWDEAEIFGAPEAAGHDVAAAGPAHDGAAPVPGAAERSVAPPSGPTLNVKHALGQAALAFVLGLSHPKRPKKRRARRRAGLPALPEPGAHHSPLSP